MGASTRLRRLPLRRRRIRLPALARRFEATIFDWDGTAVPDRHADAAPLRRLLERLSELGFDVGVVSGTHVGNVDGQLGARPSGPGRLYLCLNRGSEVYAVTAEGPSLLHRREATDEEEAALTLAAATTVERLHERGLGAEVVSQRLNRRKIDLIPEPAWADPPKARIGELVAAVEARLHRHGFRDLAEVAQLAAEESARAGLDDARITSDAKHVEIGLTDKADSARWLVEELARRGVDPDGILVGGDELGPLAGLPGSDSLMLVPEAQGATVVSVGVEPHGVPAGVVELGGGPPAFLALLQDQLRRRIEGELPSFPPDPAWSISFAGLDPVLERAHEALLAIADGRIGTSGAPLLAHSAAVARVLGSGVYDGAGAESHLLAHPVWSRIEGELEPTDRLVRTLDLRRGLLLESLGREDGIGLDSIRFSSLARAGSTALRLAARAHGLREGPPLRPPNSRKRWTGGRDEDVVWLETRTEYEAAAGAAVGSRQRRGRTYDRFASYASAEQDAGAIARSRARALRDRGFEALLCEQRSAWGDRWHAADVTIDGDPGLQLAARLALFHLRSAAAESDESAIGARGLTGPGYRGHVFWDTDVFVLPVLAATQPAGARAALEYRVRRLDAARAEARAGGRAGARFPWESARSGRDVTPSQGRLRTGEVVPIRTGDLEEHVVADVAWAASHYVDWTGDEEFARGPGRTLLIETARYWASRIRLGADGRGHIEHVIGPDEYHEDVDDNAFTNVMARWNLRTAAAAADDAGVEPDEAARWAELAEALVDGHDPGTGLYEQFAGFYRLEPLLIGELSPRRPVAADALLGPERLRGAQVLKQADVLMLHHLVPEEVAPGSLEPNLGFYEPRTAHGSSLSPAIHAGLLARAGMFEQALDALRLTARIDLEDLTQTTAGGLHLAAMGGLWQALVFGFAGLRPLRGELLLDPRLPEQWTAMTVRVAFHGTTTSLRLGHDELTLTAERPVTFRVGTGRTPVVATPQGVRVARTNGSWRKAGP